MNCKFEVISVTKYLTKQRKELLNYLSEHVDQQMTAKQISEDLMDNQISISAIYRNLLALEEEGLLKRSVREGTRDVFFQYVACEKCKESIHLSCRICGKIAHLDDSITDQLIGNTFERIGFLIDKSETILYGICNDCRRKKS